MCDGGSDGTTGGIWFWEAAGDDLSTLPTAELDSYRSATPVAGVLDPETNAPSRDGEYLYPYRVPSWKTPPNTLLRYVNNGGGGFGDPLEREPERVLVDVRDGYVTIEGAAREYGVVVTGDPENDPEGLVLDLEGTERLRQSLRPS